MRAFLLIMDIVRTDLKLKKRRKQITSVAVAGLVVLALSIFVMQLDPAVPEISRSSVWIDTVKRGDMLREVRGPGVLVPKNVRWIAAASDARVDKVLVKPGASVEPDTVLVDLSNPELTQQLAQARTALTAAEADLAALKVQLQSSILDQKATLARANAEYESARLQAEAEAKLLEAHIIPAIKYKRSLLTTEQLKVRLDVEQERAKTIKESVAAQLRAEQARLDQLRAELALRQRQVDALTVRAGIAGVLQELQVEVGQRISAGATIARVAKPGELMAELRIAETQARDVHIGQKVSVDTRNAIVEGRVTRIDPAVTNGTVQVDVEIVGDLPQGARPDQSVDGTILIEKLDNVLYVGRPAFGQPESSTSLFKLTGEGMATRVPVKLGRASVNVIEVQKGLQVGDKVILSDMSEWSDYDRLEFE